MQKELESVKIKKYRRNDYRQLIIIMVPSLVLLLLFRYIPYNGLIIAFQDFNIFKGIRNSPFVGFDQFKRAFTNSDFARIVGNTIYINGIKTLFYVPLPLIVAILLNEMTSIRLKRIIQTTIYLPHFLSWVIVAGLAVSLLSVNVGIVNRVIRALGAKPIGFMVDKYAFRWVVIFSAMWKEIGWGSIIFLASIAGIDPQLYEAAVIDGASRIARVRYITIPSITSTIVLVALLSLGSILKRSFEQVFVMYNPAVYETADIINTYVYRYGIGQLEYSYSTAIGVFNSIIGFILVITTNSLTRKYLGRSLW
ncbi:MAG: sugar ABC transporter permease [Spirochaetales bacterium]|jgi:putative aldouronate transport system permease protein|nr:sugar ABC transporter permease [Spirochaetales bacterium]